MQVSVIIPVYNAAEFVVQAVESALAQPEVAEVLLIEDGSPDNSLEICQKLADQDDRVKLLRHTGGENRGAGASRNLGMRNASCQYIAFLDADDYYLPGRFSVPSKILANNPACDGVYEAVERENVNLEGIIRWDKAGKPNRQLDTMQENIHPSDLPFALLNSGTYGSFQLNGFIFRRNILEKSGYMNENLRLHQDTDFLMRVAIVSQLYPGKLLEPVARWRVHDHNRISAPRSQSKIYKDRMAYWLSLYRWAKLNASQEIQKEILMSIVNYSKSQKYFVRFPRQAFPTHLIWTARLVRLLFYPEIIVDVMKNWLIKK